MTDQWALVTEHSAPTPDRFIRQMAVFTRNEDGSWRRDDERHQNVLIDSALVPPLLAGHGVRASVATSFGGRVELPQAPHANIGSKEPPV